MAKRSGAAGLAACLGAIIGAGFASGREVIVFFTRYGTHACWLIALSAGVLALLCALCMDVARRRGTGCWWNLYDGMPPWVRAAARLCTAMMLAVTGGALISASGWLAMLLWPGEWAYPTGAVGTLLMAWMVGRRGLGALGWISGLLTAALVAALLAAGVDRSAPPAALLATGPVSLLQAAVRAVAYAAMNLALAIGVVCRCAQGTGRRMALLCAGLGMALAALLWLSDGVYRQRPELLSEAFPIVRLLARFGRTGFLVSEGLLFLAVFTSLAAVLCALDGAAQGHGSCLRAALTLGPPLAVSLVGFEGIVDGLYAPAGLACLALVFAPLLWARRKLPLDNPRPIQYDRKKRTNDCTSERRPLR